MICCKCYKEISKTYGRVTDFGNYCKECAEQNEVESAKLYESNMKSMLEIEKKNAVKDFAEKLKESAQTSLDYFMGFQKIVLAEQIDELLKEYSKK